MALWELDEFQGATFLGYVRAVPVPAAFKAASWLPNRTIDDLAFEYIKGVRNKSVMAHVMGFDSEAPIEGRPALGERVTGELPPIKRKAKFTEKEIIRFLQPRAGTGDKQTAINSVYDITDRLLTSIQARVEWLRMQALSEDTVVYDEAGIQFAFDYGIDTNLQFVMSTGKDADADAVTGMTGKAWSDLAASNPLADLQAIDTVYNSRTGGERMATMVMSKKAFGYMQANANLRTMIRGANAPTAILSPAEVQNLLDQYGLPSIETYDVVTTKENADGTTTDARAMDETKAFMIPAGGVGETLWGPTAESRNLIGTPLASKAPGIIAVTYGTEEPPAEWVKAAAVAFPTMPNAHLLAQAKLY